MTTHVFRALAIMLFPVSALAGQARQHENNILSDQEVKNHWRLLFDGKSMNGWRGAYLKTLPTKGWAVRDDMLIVQRFGGDIVTVDEHSSADVAFPPASFLWHAEPPPPGPCQ